MNWKHIVLAVAGMLIAIFLLSRDVSSTFDWTQIPKSEPTTTVRTGYLVSNNPGLPSGDFYLIYEEPGKPALQAKLTFDGLSICAAPNGSVPCIAMSSTYDAAFGGRLLAIEGTEQNGALLVRKLQVIENDEFPRTSAVGSTFIAWPTAVQLLENCAARGVMQTHALDVYIELPDGTSVRSVEPTIDEVFRVLERTRASCPNIPVATE